MIFPVYFSHGYRAREAEFNEYFGILFEKSDFKPSIDPPSNSVNSAKLEKHLRHTSGLIAVLTRRDTSVSPYIMFEIEMCFKLGKPALVFIEDNLPDDIIPLSILQKRFSTKSYSREVFEHMHALEIFKKYIGVSPTPKYQIASKQKSCLLLGMEKINTDLESQLVLHLEFGGYKILKPEPGIILPVGNRYHFELLNLDLAIIIDNKTDLAVNYFSGCINSYQIPNIRLTTDKQFVPADDLPAEFREIIISNEDVEADFKIIREQIDLFEEDFIVLSNKAMVHNYVDALARSYSYKGHYSQDLRTQIVNNISQGDLFSNVSDSRIINRSSIENETNDQQVN